MKRHQESTGSILTDALSDMKKYQNRMITDPTPKTLHRFRRLLRSVEAGLKLFPNQATETKETSRWVQTTLKKTRNTRNDDVLGQFVIRLHLPKTLLPPREAHARELIRFLKKHRKGANKHVNYLSMSIPRHPDFPSSASGVSLFPLTSFLLNRLFILLPSFRQSQSLDPKKLHKIRIALKTLQNQGVLIRKASCPDQDRSPDPLRKTREKTLKILGKIGDWHLLETHLKNKEISPKTSRAKSLARKQKKHLAEKLFRLLKLAIEKHPHHPV